MDARSIILDRIALLRRELDTLESLVGAGPRPVEAPARPAQPAEVVARAEPRREPLRRPAPRKPTERDKELDESGIGPAEAAELLGIARQTIDRRLKQARSDVPDAPADVSAGAHRARWRWADADQVRRWWDAVR